MPSINLTKGFVALVDQEDFERVNSFRWQVSTNGYAQRSGPILMHRDILGDIVGFEIDHINGNKLDNRRANLRHVTRSQNNANQRKTRGSSKFKGVSFCKNMRRWTAYVNKDGVRYHLGYFTDELEAAKSYNNKARELFGEHTRLNEICPQSNK